MRLAEQETTMSVTAESDDYAEVWTCIPKHLRAFRNKGAEEMESGVYEDGTQWAKFRFPSREFKPAMAYRPKKERTPEQQERDRKAGERLRKAQSRKGQEQDNEEE